MKNIIFILVYSIAVLTVYTVDKVKENNELTTALGIQYSNQMADASQKLGELEDAVKKSLLYENKEGSAKEQEEIWRLSSDVKKSIATLPLDQSVSTSWMNYLGRLGNFAKEAKDSVGNEEYYATMKKASANLEELSSEWQSATSGMLTGNMTLVDWQNRLDGAKGQYNWSGMGTAVKQYTESDFPLTASESDVQKKKGLKEIKDAKITQEEAIAKFKELFPNVSGDVIGVEKSRPGSPYPFFHIKFAENSTVGYVDITEKGGHLLSYLGERRVGKESLSYEELQKKAEEFLKSAAYNDLVLEEARENDNAWHFVFVRVEPENQAKVFSDPIHMKVAKDNGEVLGLDASEYIRKEKLKSQAIKDIDWQTFFRPDVKIVKEELAYVENDRLEQRLAHFLTVVSSKERNRETYNVLVDTETEEVIKTEKQQ